MVTQDGTGVFTKLAVAQPLQSGHSIEFRRARRAPTEPPKPPKRGFGGFGGLGARCILANFDPRNARACIRGEGFVETREERLLPNCRIGISFFR
jgi:hypothetical protein